MGICFYKGVKEYNTDECVFKFKRHYVPAGRSDKTFMLMALAWSHAVPSLSGCLCLTK